MTRAVQGAARQQLHVDWTRCDGHGVCAALLPERITQDDWGYPVLHRDTFDAAELADARRAIAACPALALRLERAREHGR